MLRKIYNVFVSICKRINDDNIFVYAAQSSFYMMIAMIPFIMLLMSLAQFIITLNYDEIMRMIKPLLPLQLHEITGVVITELLDKSSGSIISITAISAIWPASRGIASVSRGVRKVYKSEEERNVLYIMARDIVYMIIFVAMLLCALVMLVFGNIITSTFANKLKLLFYIKSMVEFVSTPITFCVFCAFFAFVYRSLANKGGYLQQLPGSILSTLGWFLFSNIYSLYIANYSHYSYVYGSLTAIVLMMLWVYGCMIIFLLGAELNVLLESKPKGFGKKCSKK